MRDYARRLRTRLVRVPVPSLLFGALGWIAAAVFLLFWLFEVGAGPFDADRMGTAGEWVSGVATTGAVALSLYVLLRERHERIATERRAARRAEIAEVVGQFPAESELRREADRLVPVYGRWNRIDDDDSASEGRYRVEFELFNGLDRPLNDLQVRLLLHADWSGEDYETKVSPPFVKVCEHAIVPPGQGFTFDLPPERFYRLPVERVNNGAYMSASWRVGPHEYTWSRHSDGETFLFVSTKK